MKRLRHLAVLAILLFATAEVGASTLPGLSVPGRPWAALLIEDHKGMQEVVWDGAFTDLQSAGPFVKDHSYVIRTGTKPSLLDLGCWDAARTRGGECRGLASPANLTWTSDHKGVVLKVGTRSTWLPALAGFDGDELPTTFRGAYLNWLLTHRSTTPSIPSETRWQRVQRGTLALAEQLFSQGGGKPSYRLVGVGTSGHLLIPPGESLAQLRNAIQRMTPRSHDGEGGHGKDDDRDRDEDCDRDGSMLKALRRAYATLSATGRGHDGDHRKQDDGREHDDDHRKGDGGHKCDHRDHRDHDKDPPGHDCDHRDHRDHDGGYQASGCTPNIVLAISDGTAFGSSCGSARPYEALASYNDMLQVAGNTAATGKAVVWAWNVEGPGVWDQAFATKGKGQFFEGDAVAALLAAIKAWATPGTSGPAMTLTLSNPVLTRIPAEILTVTLSSPATSATLNGQPLVLTGLSTAVPLTLQEGANAFTVAVQSPCGSSQVSVSVVLDTVAPVITLLSPTEGWRTNAASVALTGRVDDPTASLKVNGQPLSQASGTFTATFNPAEGPFAMTVVATDPAGNSGSSARTILIDRTAPRITLTRPVPALTAMTTLTLQGSVDDPTARLTHNGSAVVLDAQGGFTLQASLTEGGNAFHFEATDTTGNVGVLDAKTVRDTTPPVVTLESPMDGLITNQRTLLVKGRVDDPTARLLVAGQSISPAADGSFQVTLSPSEGAQLVVALATDPAGNTGHATRAFTVDWTPPVITFQNPTPAEGALWKDSKVSLAIRVNEISTLSLNGQPVSVVPQSDGGLLATQAQTVNEGVFTATVTATDRAGNVATATRTIQVGLTVPVIEILSPAMDAAGQFTTRNPIMTVQGRVRASDFVKPFQMTRGGKPLDVSSDGTFTFDWNLLEGTNTATLEVATRFGQRGQKQVIGNRYTTPFGVQIEWPLNGFVTPLTATDVKGRVRREGTNVAVNGVPAVVDPRTLTFNATLPLAAGENTLVAVATDAVGNTGQDQVKVIAVQVKDTHYRWDSPAAKARFATRSIRITGQADLPGVASVAVNGNPMALSGTGTAGHFEGDLRLDQEGLNVLLMEVRTIDGDTRLERRDVYYQPALPHIRLVNPDSARPGDSIPVQVLPEPGTNLKFADLRFQGRFLVRVSAPFAPVQVQVPADATVGGSLLIEALGQDDQDQQVQARSSVTIYGGGALLVKVFDDRTGLPFRKDAPITSTTTELPIVTVAVEGGESHPLDDRGQAALATALPSSWVKTSSPGWVPVWRAGGLKSGQAEALIGTRLTPLAEAKPVDPTAANAAAEGLQMTFTTGAGQSLSATPLSGQGLPALLPMGWSPVRAWWIEGTATFPGKASVTLPGAVPSELASALFQWVRWDAEAKQWTALAVARGVNALDELPVIAAGGYALILRDPAPINPPEPLVGEKLQGVPADGWRDGLKISTSEPFQVMSTTDAIKGARLLPNLKLEFEGNVPLPSGLILQADTLESYTLVEQRLIEPESYSQDLVLHRFSLLVQPDGSHQLQSPGDSLLLRFPMRMSRHFTNTELVEGRILVGFYHDGTRLLESGTDLFGVNGGQVTRDGVQAIFDSGTFSASTLVRLQGEPNVASAWPELSSMNLVKAFQLDVVGNLQKGVGLTFTDLNLDASAKPILLARRVVQGERLILAVGELEKKNNGWSLKASENLPPVQSGGAFAVLVPTQPWDWQSGVAYAPGALLQAQTLKSSRGVKAMVAGDSPLADVVLNAGWFKAVSGGDGRFAAPATLSATGTLALNGERRDLGLAGSITAAVPAAGLELRLATVPFKLLAIEPAEGAVVSLGQVMEIATSAPIDPGGFQDVRLLQISPGTTPQLATVKKPAASATPTVQKPTAAAKSTPQRSSASAKPTKGKASKATKARKKPLAKHRAEQSKQALTLDQATVIAEVPLRRTLSVDGRTLLLIPDQVLQSGADYKLVIQNLRGVSGEVVPLTERNFKAASQPRDAGVDFSRMKLSYPNEQFDITVTVPAGSAPAWSAVEVQANSFGSSGTAIMPPLGDLTFQLKAGLGEALVVTVHLRDGNKVQGTLSRYVAEDGRTTLSQAGGRVEGPGGLAMVIPAGALDKPAEFKILPLIEPAQVADGALREGEKLKPALQVQIKGDVTLTQMPILELPATTLDPDADIEPRPLDYFGNGPLAIVARRTAILPDGTQDDFFQMVDSAGVQEMDGVRKVVGLGGLRFPDAEDAVPSKLQARPMSRMVSAGGMAAPALAAPGSDCANRKVAGVNIPPPALGTGYGNWGLALYVLQFPALQTGYRYNAGRVFRNYNSGEGCDQPAEACYAPLAGAEVYRGKRRVPGVIDSQRGRILALTDDCGRYVVNGIPVYDPSGNPASTAGSPTIPLNTYNAVDSRTGSSSEDDPREPIGHVNTNTNFWIWITAKVNPFDPNLRPPRILASLRDNQGRTRTVFHVGETASLHVDQGTDSVPVTALKLKGDGGLDQTFTSVALPKDIPVTFDKPGPWKVTLTGWSAARVQTDTAVEVLVTPYADLGPSIPGAPPRLVSWSPMSDADRGPENKVSPSDIVKLTFSEPVRVITPQTAFWMRKVDPTTGTSEPLAFQILSDGAEVTGSDRLVVEVWLVPTQRWPLGAQIKVGVESNILDQDREAFVPVSWSFTVRGAEEVGAVQSGTLSDMVVHKGKLFAVEKLGESLLDPYWDAPGHPVSGIRIFDVSSPNQPKAGVLFGAHGSVSPVLDPVYATFEVKRPDMILKDGTGRAITVEPFYLHRVIKIRKAEGISLNGVTRDVLMVATAPRVASQGSGIYVPNVQNQQGATTYLTNSTLWAYDITGDAASMDSNGAPKLLMSSSIGKTTTGVSIFGLPSGLGNAGDYLGVIWRGAGMKILSAPNWRQAFMDEAAAQGFTEAQLARRSRKYQGYYPGGGSVVATNDISHQHSVMPVYPWIGHAVISGDDEGKPVGFASLGLDGKLVTIDTKLGTDEAIVAYEGAPMANWDSRVQDLGATVDNERVLRVETLRGTWQGNTGTDQGLLLLVATDKNFWVLKGVWKATAPFSAIPLAKGKLLDLSADQDNPWAKVDIQTDPERMLVGVKVNNKGYVYSLGNLVPVGNQPAPLVPMYEFQADGPMALKNGLLYMMGNVATNVGQIQTNVPSVIIRNIEGATIGHWDGIPVIEDASKLFAGAFYDYTAAMLGNPNPDQTPQLDPKLMVTMIRSETGNDHTPFLRHYYPDLGERYLTATVKMADPGKEAKLYETKSAWFMEGSAKLFVKGREVPGAVTLEGLKVENQRLVAVTGSPRSKLSETKFEEVSKWTDDEGKPHTTKLPVREISAPYRFFIKPEFLSSFDQELRGDRDGASFVRIEFKLYENDEAYRRGNVEGSKQLEFTLKFNSNTTLFDVVRGGTWYYDPVVSGDLPGYAQRNPLVQNALDGWAKRQVTDVTSRAEFDQAVLRRLSLSQPDRIASQASDLYGTKPTEFQMNDLSKLGLDSIQAMLERLFVGLRRRVFQDVNGRPSSTEPMPFGVAQDRPTFLWPGNKSAGSNGYFAMTGDVPGAFGFRTAHVVNAIQRLEKDDLGIPDNDKSRNLDRPMLWQHDPGLQKEDFDHRIKREDGTVVADPIDGRIMPVINQRFRVNGELNPTNTLVQYWVTYPRLRKQGGENVGKGLDPINTMLTRDLVLGPTDPDHPKDVMERVALNTWVTRVNALPEPRDWRGSESTEVYQLFNEPQSQDCLPRLVLESQSIFRADRNMMNICKGQWYNTGIGILQMAMNPKWGRPFDKTSTLDNPAQKNPFVRVIARPVSGKDDGKIQAVFLDFLVLHYRAPRIDIYVNGMATVQPQMERAVDRLQQNLDLIEGMAGRKRSGDGTHASDYRYPQSMHVPLIGVYNQTSVSLDGKAISFDPLDAKDILDNQEDAAFPDRPTENQDAMRLIAGLRALVRVVWDPGFEEIILAKWKNEPEGVEGGKAWLQGIRKKLTLHAHSQGARVAAVAKTRLGTIQAVDNQNGLSQSIDVASQFDYVDYGNGAGISMWWKQAPGFRSYVHHVNRFDTVTISSGLYPPAKVKLTSIWDDTFTGLNGVLQATGFLMAPNPVFKDPGSNRWLNIKQNLLTLPNPGVAGELFARYVESVTGLWAHTFVVHESNCKSANTDNHDILGAYLCNVTRNEAETKSFPWVETPWTAASGALGYRQGPPVCENGDCGGTDSTTTDTVSGSHLLGLLEVGIDGDLPPGVEARVEIKGALDSTYPSPVIFVRGTIQHPVIPGTYHLWAYPVQSGGKTYWGRIEDPSGNVRTSIDIAGGLALQLKVKYALQ